MFQFQKTLTAQREQLEYESVKVESDLEKLLQEIDNVDLRIEIYRCFTRIAKVKEELGELRPNWFVQSSVDNAIAFLTHYNSPSLALRELFLLKHAGYEFKPIREPKWIEEAERDANDTVARYLKDGE